MKLYNYKIHNVKNIGFFKPARIKGGGGGGGGGSPCFFVKLDFKIAIDQQTKAHDQTFEGVPATGRPPLPAGQPRPYFGSILPNHLDMLKTMLWGALLVVYSLLDTYIKFHQNKI